MSDYNNEGDDDNLDLHPIVMMDTPGMVRVKKGEEINMTRLDPAIREITVGVGWDLKKFEGDPIDVDASVFLLDKNDKTREDEDFVFYNNLAGRDGAVKHMGDSRTGAGDGDDEQIAIDLMALPFEVVKIAFVLSIYDLDMNSNNFTMVKNVYFRIVNNETNMETFRFELDEDMGSATGLYIGYVERVGSDWIYRALGEPIYGGLAKVAGDFGIIVTQNIRA
ncbi:MAG: chemical-damaging agent resistance protein C [Micavibrio aeruginosavorus]|uniref:Chemical-damaging agent resistance protein C n=1 Tax=Micavibrio aeruginosavorus TaxID=349221 RepID=A0A2W5Q0D6_9BACT|nr:MAG: chemical-damaging agent resistance protein C [Micavibrio aeruginosavorus]